MVRLPAIRPWLAFPNSLEMEFFKRSTYAFWSDVNRLPMAVTIPEREETGA